MLEQSGFSLEVLRVFRSRPPKRRGFCYEPPVERLESKILLSGDPVVMPESGEDTEFPTDSEPVSDDQPPADQPVMDSPMPGPVDDPADQPTMDPSMEYGIHNTYTLAHMSAAAYTGATGEGVTKNDVTAKLPKKLRDAGWHADEITSNESGLHAVQFKNDKSGEHVLAFAGTALTITQLSDLTTDINQAVGLKAQQYEEAIQLAKTLKDDVGDDAESKIRFTGHSLGGGLASAAALVTGIKAETFNAAGVHKNTVARHGVEPEMIDMLATDLINAYRVYRSFGKIKVVADPLSQIQSAADAAGKLSLITGNTGKTIPIVLPWLPPSLSGLHPHGMQAVLEAGGWNN